ncbi:hypothetical protein O0L34_g18929 [Tuta absoluta]|nr:hypothetical protein O0L34_g18929 [Tuta absoluta]
MTDCGGCGTKILDLYFMECVNPKCALLYDLQCLNLTKEDFDNISDERKTTWLCPLCINSLPKNNNTGTPVRSAAAGMLNDTFTKNVNSKRGSRPQTPQTNQPDLGKESTSGPVNDSATPLQELTKDDLKSFQREIRDMLKSWKSEQELRLMKLEVSIEAVQKTNKENLFNLETGLESIKKIEVSTEFMSKQYEELMAKITMLEKVNRDHHRQIRGLEEKIEDLERASKTVFIEIRNVPSKVNENKQELLHVIQKISKALGTDLQPSDIRDAYRKLGRNGTNVSTKPIIAELSSSMAKFNMLAGLRKYNLQNPHNKFNTANLGYTEHNSPIFISEILTDNAGKLYFLSRKLRKEGLIDNTWTTNGKVYLRKKAGDPAILLRDETQIQSIRDQA